MINKRFIQCVRSLHSSARTQILSQQPRMKGTATSSSCTMKRLNPRFSTVSASPASPPMMAYHLQVSLTSLKTPSRSRVRLAWMARGAQCRSSLKAASTELVRTASGGCCISEYGGPPPLAPAVPLFLSLVLPPTSSAPAPALPAMSLGHLWLASIPPKRPTACFMCFWNKCRTASSNTGTSRPRKSSPIRPRLIPQYMQCSKTLLRLAPSWMKGRCTRSSSR
mmetsp:Transcript_2404/g.6061  ORF Transcript_2404/g.6061 Transcript_2404/m.6061 type:complete len:223 (+) Transcript_2404:699-1367(+)